MDQLKTMKEQIISLVQGQLAHVDTVDTEELGEAVDMIKDLAEASYYCAITKAMEEEEKKGEEARYYTEPRREYEGNRMYYSDYRTARGGSYSDGGSNNRYYIPDMRPYTEPGYMPMQMRESMPAHDYREGRSYNSRRMYMETKETHQGVDKQKKELEHYMKDLSEDITEMIQGATPEEKQLLQQKINALAAKIV